MEPRPAPHTQNLADPRIFDTYRTTTKSGGFAASSCEVLRGRESGRRVSNPRPSAWEAETGRPVPADTGNFAVRKRREQYESGQEGCPRQLPETAVVRTVARSRFRPTRPVTWLLDDPSESQCSPVHPPARDRSLLVRQVVAERP